MAGWEIVHLGQRLWRATKREARQLAQDLANQSRQKVTVTPAKAAAATMRRNPAKQPARNTAGRTEAAYLADVAERVRGKGYRMTAAAKEHARFNWRAGNITPAGASNMIVSYLREGFYPSSVYAQNVKQPARMKRNPDPLAFVPFWTAQGQAQVKRREYVAATKGRRLAKSLRGADRGGAAKAAEAGARKTAKFKVHATNKRDTLTLYRPSRRAADDLAAQFVAAGYSVKVSEA